MTQNRVSKFVVVVLLACVGQVARAQDDDAALAMAKKAQDPLGEVRAIMTDNTIALDGGPDDDTSYGFQFQPVYAIPSEGRINMIVRAVIPLVGVDPGVVLPPLGPDERPSYCYNWGMSYSFVQYFFSP